MTLGVLKRLFHTPAATDDFRQHRLGDADLLASLLQPLLRGEALLRGQLLLGRLNDLEPLLGQVLSMVEQSPPRRSDADQEDTDLTVFDLSHPPAVLDPRHAQQIGVELENPFSPQRMGHLPLDDMTQRIETTLLALLNEASGGAHADP